MLAESLHTSGVTAVVVASVVLGTLAPRLTGARGRLQQGAVYETVIFLLESVVFGLIGLQLPVLVRQLTSSETAWPLYALVVTLTLLMVRVLWVFPLSALQQRRSGADRPSWQVPAVVSWASANVVVLGLAARNGTPISFWQFTRYGIVVAGLSILLAARPTCGSGTSHSLDPG